MRIASIAFFSVIIATNVLISGCSSEGEEAAGFDPVNQAAGTGGTTGGDLSGGDLGTLDMGINEQTMGSTVDALESQATQAQQAGNQPLANAYNGGADFLGEMIGTYGQLSKQLPNMTSSMAQSLDNQFLQMAQEAAAVAQLFEQLGMQSLADLFKKLAERKNIWRVYKNAGGIRKDAVAANLKEVVQFAAFGYKIGGGAFVSYVSKVPFFPTTKLIRCFDATKAMFFVTKAATCPSGSGGATNLGYIATDTTGGALPLKEMRSTPTSQPTASNSITTASANEQKKLKAAGYKETLLGYVF